MKHSISLHPQHLFLYASIVLSISGLIYYPFENIYLALIGAFVYSCLGLTVGYHRLLTHDSFKTNIWITRLLSLFGAVSNNGSPYSWAASHVTHHIMSDTEQDPTSPRHYSIYDLYHQVTSAEDKQIKSTSFSVKKASLKIQKRLFKDPFQKFLTEQYYYVLFGFPMILLGLFGLEFTLFFHAMGTLLSTTIVVLSTIYGHKEYRYTYRPYDTPDKTVNNIPFALITWGETLHNNHHQNQKNWSFSHRWYEPDIGAWIVRLINDR